MVYSGVGPNRLSRLGFKVSDKRQPRACLLHFRCSVVIISESKSNLLNCYSCRRAALQQSMLANVTATSKGSEVSLTVSVVESCIQNDIASKVKNLMQLICGMQVILCSNFIVSVTCL